MDIFKDNDGNTFQRTITDEGTSKKNFESVEKCKSNRTLKLTN